MVNRMRERRAERNWRRRGAVRKWGYRGVGGDALGDWGDEW